MGTEAIVQEINLLYTIGSAYSWWDDSFTEALGEAVTALKDRDLIRANVNILKSIVEGSYESNTDRHN